MTKVHTVSCRLLEYNDKTSCEFKFEYPDKLREDKYRLLLYSLSVFNKLVEKYGLFGFRPSTNYKKYNSLIHHFVKDILDDYKNHAKEDKSIQYRDNILYINIFSGEGYLINVYKIELLETKGEM